VPPLFTDYVFHNLGVGAENYDRDPGREAITHRAVDRGRFKTPTLRSVANTAPYFHDGSQATLEAAVDFVLAGGHPNPRLDGALTPLVLTREERADLLAFLRSLSPP
jgi:cytochrome c peroxidase